MPISVTDIGSATAAAGSNATITVPAGGVPSGALIFAGCGIDDTTASTSTVADSASNTYTAIQNSLTGGSAIRSGITFYVKNCTALVQNNTIILTPGSSTNNVITAFYATGVDTANPLDTAVTAKASGSSTTPSVTSGTPGQSGELFVGVEVNAAGMTLRYTQASGWSTPPDNNFTGLGGIEIGGGNQINSGSAALTFNPTLTTSSDWAIFVQSFRAAAAAINFVFIADPPVTVRTRLQQRDLAFTFAPLPAAPRSARGDFEQPRMVKRMQFDPLLIEPPRVPPAAPFEWKVARGDFEQNRLMRRMQPDPLLIEPPFPPAAVLQVAGLISDVAQPIKIKTQDAVAWSIFTPVAAAAPTMAWMAFDQPVPIRARLQEDNLASTPQFIAGPPIMPTVYDEAYATTVFIYDALVAPPQPPPPPPPVLAWTAFDQSVPLRVSAQQDNLSIFLPSVVAPTMAWSGFEQPIVVKARAQSDNLAAPLLPLQFRTPMAWLFDQPIVVKMRPPADIAAPFPSVAAAPTMSWLLDQPVVLKTRPQADNLATLPFPPPTLPPPMAWTGLDQPIPIKLRAQADNAGLAPQAPAVVAAPTMAWAGFDQPIRLKLNFPSDNLSQTPQLLVGPPIMPTVYDEAYTTTVFIYDALVQPPQPPPAAAAAPTMAWLLDQPIPLRIRAQSDVLVGIPFPPPTLPPTMAWTGLDQPIPIKLRAQADNAGLAPQAPAVVAAPTMAWAGFDQPIRLKLNFPSDNLSQVPQLLVGPPIMPTVYDEAYTTTVFIYDAMVLPPQPPAAVAAVPPMGWQFDQPVPIKMRVQDNLLTTPQPFAAAQLLAPQPSEQPIPVKLRLAPEIMLPPFPPAILPPTMAWTGFEAPIPMRIAPAAAPMAGAPFPRPAPFIAPGAFQPMDLMVQVKIKPQADTISWTIVPAVAPTVVQLHYRHHVGGMVGIGGAFTHQ